MGEYKFKLVENGIEKEYVAMGFIDIDDKKYIWYKEVNATNDEGYISRYNVVEGNMEIIPVTDKDEWNMIVDAFTKEGYSAN